MASGQRPWDRMGEKAPRERRTSGSGRRCPTPWRRSRRSGAALPSGACAVRGARRGRPGQPAGGRRARRRPDGDAAGMAALVLQASEAGFARTRPGRRCAVRCGSGSRAGLPPDRRARHPAHDLRLGRARLPLARRDHPRRPRRRRPRRRPAVAGARPRACDVLVSAVPRPHHRPRRAGVRGAGRGRPGVLPRPGADDVADVWALAPPSVLAVPSAAAADPWTPGGSRGRVTGLRPLLLVGAPSPTSAGRRGALARRCGGRRRPRRARARGARVLWGECAPGSGLHTYPDLDLVDLVDPETGGTRHGPARSC